MNDSISRQAAIEHLKKRLYETALNNDTEHPYYEEMADNRVSVWLEELPSIDPVKHGKWIFDPDGMDWNIPAWVCSECRGRNDMIPTYIRGKDKMIKVEHPLRWSGSKFCPNCGARMDEVEE